MMGLRLTVRRERGDSLVEVIMALAILGAVLISSFTLAIKSYKVGEDAKLRTQVSNLMQEQAEALRSFRDTHTWSEFQFGDGTGYPICETPGHFCGVNVRNSFGGNHDFHMERRDGPTVVGYRVIGGVVTPFNIGTTGPWVVKGDNLPSPLLDGKGTPVLMIAINTTLSGGSDSPNRNDYVFTIRGNSDRSGGVNRSLIELCLVNLQANSFTGGGTPTCP